jgi:hypothetical protein
VVMGLRLAFVALLCLGAMAAARHGGGDQAHIVPSMSATPTFARSESAASVDLFWDLIHVGFKNASSKVIISAAKRAASVFPAFGAFLGDPHGSHNVAIVGDSLAAQFGRALDPLAKKYATRLHFFTRGSCPAMCPGYAWSPGDQKCNELKEVILNLLLRFKVRNLLVGGGGGLGN